MSGHRLDIDELICKILNVGAPGSSLTKTVKESDIMSLCEIARNVFLQQSSLIEIDPPIRICGDTHGQYADVMRLFDRGGFPPCVNYLFLGDYVDRGRQNLETICLFFCYKVKYPENFFLLRGNHECSAINRVYGFFEECNRRYQSVRLWQAFQDTFNCMPFCGLVGQKILCMHGGLSPQLKSIEQSDPDNWIRGWLPNTRGVSYVYGPDVVTETIVKLDIDLVARAHQVVQDGYEFFANRKLVTIFSAPHYCGQFDNAAAMMNVDENLVCSFQILRPSTKINRVAATSGLRLG